MGRHARDLHAYNAIVFRVHDSGCMVQGPGFRVQGGRNVRMPTKAVFWAGTPSERVRRRVPLRWDCVTRRVTDL